MTTQAQRPRGRRPGNSDTRAEIQAAALTLFSDLGYDKVSLRSIARAAEVDPALIHHYFENKADLFSRSILDQPLDVEATVGTILDGPREGIGERTASVFLELWDRPGAAERFTAMLRAATTDTNVRRPLTEFLVKEVLVKVTESLGHADALLRAQLGVSQLLGFGLGRKVLKLPMLTKTRTSVLVAQLGRSLQTCLVD